MVELNGTSHDPALERWLDTTRELLESGYTKEDLDSLLTSAPENTGKQGRLPHFRDEDPDTVYTDLPPGLIDLPTAARKFNLKPVTIRSWVSKGRIRLLGRLRAPTTGGGYLVMSEEELLSYMSAPRDKGGRPRKTYSG